MMDVHLVYFPVCRAEVRRRQATATQIADLLRLVGFIVKGSRLYSNCFLVGVCGRCRCPPVEAICDGADVIGRRAPFTFSWALGIVIDLPTKLF